MNASSFIHVICWLVQNNSQPLDLDNLRQQMTDNLWPNTKIRMQRWKASIGAMEPVLPRKLFKQSDIDNPQWSRFMSLVHEIVLSESLTRVLFAVVSSQTQCNDVRDIAADVVNDSLQMKRRATKIVDSAPRILIASIENTHDLVVLNQHIADLMLSQLPNREIARSFALNKSAYDEFVKCAGPYREEVIKQANVALGLAFSNGIQNLSTANDQNRDINQKIIDNISELFVDPSGFPGRHEMESAKDFDQRQLAAI